MNINIERSILCESIIDLIIQTCYSKFIIMKKILKLKNKFGSYNDIGVSIIQRGQYMRDSLRIFRWTRVHNKYEFVRNISRETYFRKRSDCNRISCNKWQRTNTLNVKEVVQ